MEGEIVNKVAGAGIEQIDLKDFLSNEKQIGIDLKDRLWNELVLKEKDFRDWIKQHDWSVYADANVYVYCSIDAIIPAWAFMLITAQLADAKRVLFGTKEEVESILFFDALMNWDVSDLEDKRIMVKGCSTVPNPNRAYVLLTERLMPVAKSLMFGEPCSAVPVYKKPRK